ncbi:MAG: nitrate/sulfonate/bicarbonate ABC transporter ATP-binding protein [Opitutia bacterium]|nr:ABC transporter ATP-binding protein [Opitutaceae bacterium]PHX72197.1 MAG: nitrate/sulfonate/bicarbonate ABC transporter ATP-binding protein [Opitutae bacterium]
MPVPLPPIVEFRDATKRFGEGPLVLDLLNLTVQPGEFVSLIGPSGCGKSTLLRLIAGLTPLTAGSLIVDRRSPDAAAADLAFVFQEPTLLPWLSVAANVELPLSLRGVAPAERSVTRRRVLDLVRLSEKADAYPRQLSGGQKMRVSIARALALSPKILLLDEPFGALDEMTREHLNEELLTIRERHAWTAFFVTHSVAEAVFLSNRIFIFSANPGHLHTEIPVPFPYPRTEATRRSRPFHDLVADVSRILRSVESDTV